MSGRVKKPLPRWIQAILFVVVLGIWIPMGVFLLEVTSLRLHWWTAPWPAAGHRALLMIAAALAAGSTVLFAGMAWFRWKRRPSGEGVDGRECFVNSLSALIYAGVAWWCGSALRGFPSDLALFAMSVAFSALNTGLFIIELWRVRERLRAVRRGGRRS